MGKELIHWLLNTTEVKDVSKKKQQ